jgi:hypothetical protein
LLLLEFALSNDCSKDSSDLLLLEVSVPFAVANLLFKFTWAEEFSGMVVEFIPKEMTSSMAQSGMSDWVAMLPPPSVEDISFWG